jgi:sec-independent protein translocase protein TatA
MFELSVWKLVLVALVVLVLFGRGKVADFMGEFGKGIKSFKQGMNDESDRPAPPPPAQLTAQPPAANAPAQPLPAAEPVPEQQGQN